MDVSWITLRPRLRVIVGQKTSLFLGGIMAEGEYHRLILPQKYGQGIYSPVIHRRKLRLRNRWHFKPG
jgi:hypothetical protein